MALENQEKAAVLRCTARRKGYACIRWRGHGGSHMYAPKGLSVEQGIEGFVQALKNEAKPAAVDVAKEE